MILHRFTFMSYALALTGVLLTAGCEPPISAEVSAHRVSSNPTQLGPRADPAMVDDSTETPMPTAEHACEGGDYSKYFESDLEGGSPELHIVGVYKSHSGPGSGVHPKGELAVHVSRPGKHVLVLSSYEPIHWTVTAAAGATVERVVLNGYHAQTATVPTRVPVETHTYEGGTGYLASTAYEWPSYRATDLALAVTARTGLKPTSFRGCYRSTAFTIGEPIGYTPPAAPAPASHRTLPAGCESIAAESRYCLALIGFSSPTVAAIGLDSGRICRGSAVRGADLSFPSSLGWIGSRLYACDRDRGVVEVAISDGSTRIAPVSCEAATNHGTKLLVMPGLDRGPFEPIEEYADFASAAARHPSGTYDIGYYASRMATQGGTVAFAWHSTDEVKLAPLASGATSRTVKLEGFADWVYGLDLTDDGYLVVASRDGIRLFDAATGKLVKRVPAATGIGELSGLKCRR